MSNSLRYPTLSVGFEVIPNSESGKLSPELIESAITSWKILYF